MRIPSLICCWAVAATACNSGTFIALQLEQNVQTPPTVSIDLMLQLDGRPAAATLSEANHRPVSFPSSVALQIGSGSGHLTVDGTARDASGTAINQASGAVDVIPGATVPLTLHFGGLVGDGGAIGAPGVPTLVVPLAEMPRQP